MARWVIPLRFQFVWTFGRGVATRVPPPGARPHGEPAENSESVINRNWKGWTSRK